MTEENDNQEPQQVCTMRIAFPVTTDEEAIEYKKKITDVLSGSPKARIEFSLMTIPVGLPNAPQIR